MTEPVRGAIVTTAGVIGVVWEVSPSGTHIFPVVIRGAGRHRSDVQHGDSRLPASGTVRPGAMRVFNTRITVIGHVSKTLFRKLEQAFAAESAATRYEVGCRFPANPPTEIPVRL